MHNRYTILNPASVISLAGSESLDLLQRISTNELGGLSVGESRETVFLTEKGKIIAVATVIRSTDTSILVSSSSAGVSAMRAWIEKFIIMEDIKIADLSSEYSKALLYAIDQDSITRIRSVLPPDMILSTGFHGCAGICQILSPSVDELKLSQVLESRGFRLESPEMFEEFRIVAGVPVAPFELSTTFNPLEAVLTNLISWTKGCYVGQEVVARLDTYNKVQRRLVPLGLAELPDSLPTTLYAGDEMIGLVTSATQRRIEGHYRALGYVQKNQEYCAGGWSFRSGHGQSVEVILERVS